MAVKKISLDFCDFSIGVNLRKNSKYLRLKVSKDGVVSLSAPYKTSKASILFFLDKNKEWIISSRQKALLNQTPKNEILHLGKRYKIVFCDIEGTQIKEEKIYVKNLDELEKFQKKEAIKLFTFLIEKLKPLVAPNDVNLIKIKKMKTRWGSCNYKKGYINLNLFLIHKEISLIEYVILHELTHLIHHNHDKNFYNFIQNIMPDFKQRESKLRN